MSLNQSRLASAVVPVVSFSPLRIGKVGRSAVRLLAAVAVILLPAAANAGNGTWLTLATTSNWTNAGNWSGAVPGAIVAITGANANADIATFSNAVGTYGTSSLPIVIDSASENIKGITFDAAAGGYYIGTTTGNPLYLTQSGTIQLGTTGTSFTGSGITETVNAPLVIEGNGAAATTYTITNNSTTASDVLNFGGPITSGGNFGYTCTLTLNGVNTGANTLSGSIGNGTTGSGMAVTVGAGNWVLSGANTYQGNTTLSGGTIVLGGANAPLGNGGLNLNAAAGNIQAGVSGVNLFNPITLTAGSGGTFSGTNGITLSGMLVPSAGSGTVTNNISGGLLTVAGNGVSEFESQQRYPDIQRQRHHQRHGRHR